MKLFTVTFLVLMLVGFQGFAQQGKTTTTKTTTTTKAEETKKVEPETTAQDVTASTEGAECKSGMAVRKLTVVTKGTGCEVEYTKDGDTSTIGSAQNDSNYCGMLVSKVRNRLEDSGFTCATK